LSINFEETLSGAHENFEEHNKVLESSISIINYFIIINNHYITNEILVECDKNENLEVTGGVTTS
jgi:hypothetical protein